MTIINNIIFISKFLWAYVVAVFCSLREYLEASCWVLEHSATYQGTAITSRQGLCSHGLPVTDTDEKIQQVRKRHQSTKRVAGKCLFQKTQLLQKLRP